MKGNVWHERRDAKDRKGNPIVSYPVYVEDKHDEIRCHVKVDLTPRAYHVEFLSYAGKPLMNMGEFSDAFIHLAVTTGYKEFDMGFEVNGNFNDSYRWVRSTRGLPDDLYYDATCKFYVFGLPDFAEGTMEEQMARRQLVLYAGRDNYVTWVIPHYVIAHNQAEVDEAFHNARSRGLEGVMVKQMHAKYERKRTDGWLKMKPSDDADGVIVGLHEAVSLEGVPLGRTGSVTIRLEDGSEATPHGIPHELGTDMHNNPMNYLSRWAEFRFMERDRQGGYRHPVWGRLREAK